MKREITFHQLDCSGEMKWNRPPFSFLFRHVTGEFPQWARQGIASANNDLEDYLFEHDPKFIPLLSEGTLLDPKGGIIFST